MEKASETGGEEKLDGSENKVGLVNARLPA